MEVRAWVVRIGSPENLHIIVKLFHTDGSEETEADEPYKTEAEWKREGWTIHRLTVEESSDSDCFTADKPMKVPTTSNKMYGCLNTVHRHIDRQQQILTTLKEYHRELSPNPLHSDSTAWNPDFEVKSKHDATKRQVAYQIEYDTRLVELHAQQENEKNS